MFALTLTFIYYVWELFFDTSNLNDQYQYMGPAGYIVLWQAWILVVFGLAAYVLLFRTCWRGRNMQKQITDRHLHDVRDAPSLTDEEVVKHLEDVNKTIGVVIGITFMYTLLSWMFSRFQTNEDENVDTDT